MSSTGWQSATVVAIRDETERAKTFRLRLSEVRLHRAGQHFVVRLTAPDGYTASRSYSVASAPDASGEIELTVELLDDGEVSSFLHARWSRWATSSRCGARSAGGSCGRAPRRRSSSAVARGSCR